MATGDIRGNLERLKVQLRSISYPHAVDTQGCKDGLPAAILPLVHYALLGYSRHLARYLSINGYVLYAKSDLRFVECVMKLLRKEFDYRCPLTVAQIFARGFAEKKFLFVHDLIQMCKRKHNDLMRIIRLNEKKRSRAQPKAFGRILQKPTPRNRHLSSKFDRRCELDLLPDVKCQEICSRAWVQPSEIRTRLSAVVDDEGEERRADCFERAKQHGLQALTRSREEITEERCWAHGSTKSKASPKKTALMGAQIIHREHGCGSVSSEPAFEDRTQSHEITSPRSSPGFTRPKQGNTFSENCTPICPSTREPQEGCPFGREFTKPDFVNDEVSKLPTSPVRIMEILDHTSGSLAERITSKEVENQSQIRGFQPVLRTQTVLCRSQECSPHDCPYENQSSALENDGQPSVQTRTTADYPPQVVWQKIMDLAGKIDSCFCSLDNKIVHSFNSFDNKLETKFEYLDKGVTCTRETLQGKLNLLENRIQQLERTSQISPMSFHSNITYNDDGHPIRDITNTFNNSIDNPSWRNFAGLQSREPLFYYPSLLQQEMQTIQNIPMYAGLLKATTQEFIAGVRARFNQTRELLRVTNIPLYGTSIQNVSLLAPV